MITPGYIAPYGYQPSLSTLINESVKDNMEECLSTILAWLKPHFMSCNTDKTEMAIITPIHGPIPIPFNIVFNGDTITPSKQIINLGAIFDNKMTVM